MKPFGKGYNLTQWMSRQVVNLTPRVLRERNWLYSPVPPFSMTEQ